MNKRILSDLAARAKKRGYLTKKRICRLLGLLMLAGAAYFLFYAFHHPEGGLSLPLELTHCIYGVYILVMLYLLAAPDKVDL